MKKLNCLSICLAAAGVALPSRTRSAAAEPPPKAPRFSVDQMDRSVDPGTDFYRFAGGTWLKNNPVPADKSRWTSFEQLQERNWYLIREILEASATDKSASANSSTRKVGDFFASAINTNRLERLGLKPVRKDFKRIAALKSADELLRLLADFQQRGVGAMFAAGVWEDEKNSAIYAFHLGQGGLGLPDRDYYLTEGFAKQREAYGAHIAKMLTLAGETKPDAQAQAARILALETAFAQASKSRTDLRDPVANYHKFAVAELPGKYPSLAVRTFLGASGLDNLADLVVQQPEFFAALDKLVKERPLDDWKVYLRWHVLRSAAPYLSEAVENESFAFYGTTLRGQPAPEPRWQRAAKAIEHARA